MATRCKLTNLLLKDISGQLVKLSKVCELNSIVLKLILCD